MLRTPIDNNRRACKMSFKQLADALALMQWIPSAFAFDTTGSKIKLLDNVRYTDVDTKALVCLPAGLVLRVVNAKSADSVTVKIDSFTRPAAVLPAGCSLPRSTPVSTAMVQSAARKAALGVDPNAPLRDVDAASLEAATAAISEREGGTRRAEDSATAAARRVAPTLADNVIKAIAQTAASLAAQETPYEEFKIPAAELAKHDYIRRGLSYGSLVVPFKYQTHDHSLQQGVTIGGYLGVQLPFGLDGLESNYDFTFTLLIFAGGSWATLSQTQTNGSTQTTTNNQLGISYGVGTLFTINNSYQLGVIVGWDRLGSNASPPSPYEGKAWVSFAIGWNFAQ